MTQKIKFRLIKPAKVIHEAFADMIVMPGSEGELGAMYGHVPMIVQLKAGELRIYNGDKIDKLSIEEGIARINEDSVDVIWG